MKSLAVSFVLASVVLVSRGARAETEGARTAAILVTMGAIDLAFATHDVLVLRRGETSSPAYGAWEMLLTVPQVALGVVNVARTWNTTYEVHDLPPAPATSTTVPNSWSHRAVSLAILAVPTALAVNGLRSVIRKERPSTDRNFGISPALLGDGAAAGMAVFGRF